MTNDPSGRPDFSPQRMLKMLGQEVTAAGDENTSRTLIDRIRRRFPGAAAFGAAGIEARAAQGPLFASGNVSPTEELLKAPQAGASAMATAERVPTADSNPSHRSDTAPDFCIGQQLYF